MCGVLLMDRLTGVYVVGVVELSGRDQYSVRYQDEVNGVDDFVCTMPNGLIAKGVCDALNAHLGRLVDKEVFDE